MTTNLHKFGIVLCTIFLTICADVVRQPIKVLDVNGCALKYKKDVPDKPDIFFITENIPGVCRLQKHQQKSTENYENFRIEYYKKEHEHDDGDWARGPIIPDTIQKFNKTEYQALTYDVQTKSLMYIHTESRQPRFGPRNDEMLVRRRFNDSQFVQTLTKSDLFENSALKFVKMYDLAYDWRTKNLFINKGIVITVINLEKHWNAIDVVSGVSIRSFAIHPNAGYLFFVECVMMDEDYDNTTHRKGSTNVYGRTTTSIVYRTHLDGSNKQKIGPNDTHRGCVINNLVIDFHTDRLYWRNEYLNLIQSSEFDGTNVKVMEPRGYLYGYLSDGAPRMISFDKKYVYYMLRNGSVRRFDKETLREDEDFEIVNEGEGLLAEMVVYDPEAYKITTDHPCLINNGGCEQYCMVLPKDHTKMGPARTCLSSNI